MKVAIGCDHAGYELKDHLIAVLKEGGVEINDHGTNGPDSVDYPDFGHAVCSEVEAGEVDFGILICGTANGMAMTANKHAGIRCGLCWTPEIASLTKQHNNANVIALPARFLSLDEGLNITKAYMEATYEGGRHQKRIDKIAC
ncbi:MAG: ribose 5-phosphate isomerase B [Flavobacteriales bacterium]|nr:ribose 5-phosphate isomerase B [Flavobacteriales bacterium]